MTAPTRSFDTDFGRFYRHPEVSKPKGRLSALANVLVDDTSRYQPQPSITNIMKMMDEGFLPGYYSKLVASYAVTNKAEINELQEQFGDQAAMDFLKGVPLIPHPNAAIGDEVHKAIDEFFLIGPQNIPNLTTTTAKAMYAQWLWFYIKHAPEIIRTEYTVWNYTVGYAGTGDLMVRMGDDTWAWDTKTGTRIYPKVAMQLAASQNGEVIVNKDGTTSPMIPIAKLGCLHIRPRSIKLYQILNEAQAWEAFKACKTLFDWNRFYKEQSIGGIVMETKTSEREAA